MLGLLCAAVLTLIATADLYLLDGIPADRPLPLSVRTPAVGVFRDSAWLGTSYRVDRITVGRGSTLTKKQARMLAATQQRRRPPGRPLLVGLGAATGLVFLLLIAYLAMQGGLSAQLRTQAILLLLVLLLCAAAKLILMLTDWSPLWFPLLALCIPIAVHVDRRSAAAVGIACAIAAALLVPVDMALGTALAAQGLIAVAVVRPQAGAGRILAAGLLAAFGGLIVHGSIELLLQQRLHLGPLTAGFDLGTLLEADLAAAAGAPLLGGAVGWLALGPLRSALGQTARKKLTDLADFENPGLRRLSSRAPGTWAHSVNMANMAEMCSKAIGANGLLLRVAAYYHDLGKSEFPEYFIENQSGENPHDKLEPEVSADAIMAHVTDGVKLARRHGLPEEIIAFIYTHHGDEPLAYFWHKKLKAGNPEGMTEDDFRYPGVRPQTREQGILSVVDAVEAASKTLKEPSINEIRELVRQITFTKLQNGMLDECGLSIGDLHRLTETLVETLRSSMHVRVKYPWQRDKKAAAKGPGKKAAAGADGGRTANDGKTRRARGSRPGAAKDPHQERTLAGLSDSEESEPSLKPKKRPTRPLR